MKRTPKKKSRYWARRSKKFGRRAHVFNDKEALVLLKAAVENEGSQAAFADRHGIHRSYISMILNGRHPVTDGVAKALSLSKVYVRK